MITRTIYRDEYVGIGLSYDATGEDKKHSQEIFEQLRAEIMGWA